MMLKTVCILLLCVVSAFAVLEEKKAKLSWAFASSDLDNPVPKLRPDTTVDAPKIWDGILTNMQHTLLYDKEPYMLLTFKNYPFYVSYVEVVNRNEDCCRGRIDPFTTFLAFEGNLYENFSVDALKVFPYTHWRTTSGTKNVYRVPFPNALAYFGRIQQHQNTWMNLAEISFIQMYRPPYTGSAASSQYPLTDLGWTADKAYDANVSTWFHTDTEANPWLELQFASQKICRVTLWNRWEDCPVCRGRIVPFTVALKNGVFTTGATTKSIACGEAGATCSPSVTGTVTDYYEIDFSSEPVADRVRIYQETPGYMNVAEVQVYACSFPADFAYMFN